MLIGYLILAAFIVIACIVVMLIICAVGFVYGWISELYAQRKFEQRQEDYKKRI